MNILNILIIIFSLRKNTFFEDYEVIPTERTTDVPNSESIFHRIEEEFPDNDDDHDDENYQREITAEENISNTCRSKYLLRNNSKISFNVQRTLQAQGLRSTVKYL